MFFKIENKCCIYFNDDFNEPLNENHIEELKKLIKEGNKELILPDRERDSYKHSIDLLSELDELEVLNLNAYKEKVNKLPPNLKEFYGGTGFNQKIGNSGLILPDSIEKLVFGFRFNNIIEKYPINLKSLELGKRFNQPVDNLPEGLEVLYISGDFNQPLDKLPKSLKFLSMYGMYGCKFNYTLDNLPDGLMELYLTGDFNHPLDYLPSSLKNLYINSFYTHSLNNLPYGLININLPHSFNETIDYLPDTLEKIILPEGYKQEINKLPKNLKNMVISIKYPLLKKFKSRFGKLLDTGIVFLRKDV